jgi:transcription initiation factor TFIID TATA-box-binding protein
MLKVTNVVGSGDLGKELHLKNVAVDLPQATYDERQDIPPTLHKKIDNQLVLVYRTGSFVIRGAKSVEKAESAAQKLSRLFIQKGIISCEGSVKFEINNIVCLGDLDREINLNEVVVKLGLENTEFHPEQFPGLVYRQPDLPACTIFSSGKVVISGAQTLEDASNAFTSIQDLLSIE